MSEYIIKTPDKCEALTAWIAKFIEENEGVGPTVREAGKAWGMSHAWASKHFDELEEREYIRRYRNRAGQIIHRKVVVIVDVDVEPYEAENVP